jgi:isocitrate dehydrogenase
MSTKQPTIIYTLTDEAPYLATHAFLPIVRTFAAAAGIDVTRATSRWPTASSASSPIPDRGAEGAQQPGRLGKKTLQPDANIIKLPNISASQNQLVGHPRTAGQGLHGPGVPGEPEDRRGKGDPRATPSAWAAP